MVSPGSLGIALVPGLAPVLRAPVDFPNHRLTTRLNVDMFNSHFLLAFAAVFVQGLNLPGIDGEELRRVF